MYIEKTVVKSNQEIESGIFLISVNAPSIASTAAPGQFCNIKVSENDFPLLRRPFSICNIDGENVQFLFDIHGEGTRILSQRKAGDELDMLGPLGKGFILTGNYDTAVIVAGGLGSAPFPFLIKKIPVDKNVICFVGGRTKKSVVTHKMKNVLIATDDGTDGFHGTVVQLLKSEEQSLIDKNIRIFGCGPNPMLKALQDYSIQKKIDCQISIESAMACGFGICQGCPVERTDNEGFYLICKDGPVFEAKLVKL